MGEAVWIEYVNNPKFLQFVVPHVEEFDSNVLTTAVDAIKGLRELCLRPPVGVHGVLASYVGYLDH